MTIPAKLLHAAGSRDGRLVIVIGAGCSVEPPTSLPLSGDLSETVHRKLVLDGLLGAGDCKDPRDLSEVADVIYAKRRSQDELVARMPVDQMKTAGSNEGYKILAALMREGIVLNVLSLNYDLALVSALAALGGSNDIGIIDGPANAPNLKSKNLIFLHRSAHASPDDWIMRTEQMNDEWKDNWEEVVVGRVLASPVVLFAGLGSPAAVLTSTVSKIQDAAPGVAVFQGDVADFGQSAFTSMLKIGQSHYVKLGFSSLMQGLANRYLAECMASLVGATRLLVKVNKYREEDIEPFLNQIQNAGILALGRLRARFGLEHRSYVTSVELTDEAVADIIHGICAIAREASADVQVAAAGHCLLIKDGRPVAILAAATGRGVLTFEAMDARRSEQNFENFGLPKLPIITVLTGVQGGIKVLSAPVSIVTGPPKDDIISGATAPILDLAEFRKGAVNLNSLIGNE